MRAATSGPPERTDGPDFAARRAEVAREHGEAYAEDWVEASGFFDRTGWPEPPPKDWGFLNAREPGSDRDQVPEYNSAQRESLQSFRQWHDPLRTDVLNLRELIYTFMRKPDGKKDWIRLMKIAIAAEEKLRNWRTRGEIVDLPKVGGLKLDIIEALSVTIDQCKRAVRNHEPPTAKEGLFDGNRST